MAYSFKKISTMKKILKNKTLFKNLAYINGEWMKANNSKTFPVCNPATNELLARVPEMGQIETTKAIEAAQLAFEHWKTSTASQRATLLRKWYDLLIEHQHDLAMILTAEQGKPLNEAIGEIKYGAQYIEWFAEETRRIYGDMIPGQDSEKRIMIMKQPIGVVGIITPWNFPNAMIARKIGAALAAGCTVVIKPAEATPLSALAMVALAEQAGFPKGVINIVTTSKPAAVGTTLCQSPLVRKISFTGSTKVGKMLIRQCADTVKRVTMELGGNAPFIVFDDADIDAAVLGAIQSKYRNAGQTCVCANRIYVQNKVYDSFVEKFTQAVERLKIGNGMENGVEIGPLINQAALEKVERLVKDALDKGALLKTGGVASSLGHTFYPTTVLANTTAEMALHKEEIFGPVAPIFRFDTEDEVIALANNSEYGLASYFYGNNINRIFRVAEALEFGMVGVNTGLLSTVTAPFGGMKQSGYGREGSKYGIDDYLEIKYVCFGNIK
jgi:succinate-semialdehyde dehydrogenase / glutarate-semialdehyde dehydrogenase